MAVRFPDISQTVDPVEEGDINYFVNHLIACVNNGRAPCYPNAMAIDSNTNRIYVAERHYYSEDYPSNNISRVSIFSETGEFLNTFTHPHMKWPCGIAIHRDNVYVTDKFKYFLFHFTMGLGLDSSITDNQPRQLAVSSNGEIFVADSYNNRIQILDCDLHNQRLLSHHSMTRSHDVKLTPDEVFVLCQTSPCVKVFSYTGELIRSIVTCGSFRMEVRAPLFFCLDPHSNLLLCNCLNHRIEIFSKEGTLLHTLGDYGHEVRIFCNPQGINSSH